MRKAAFRLGVGLVLALLGLVWLPASAFERAPLPSEAPMEPCPREGAGFVRIPGTTTCLRLSGRVAAGLQTGAGRTAAPVMGRLSVDTRSETDLGPVRSFVRIDAGRH